MGLLELCTSPCSPHRLQEPAPPPAQSEKLSCPFSSTSPESPRTRDQLTNHPGPQSGTEKHSWVFSPKALDWSHSNFETYLLRSSI